MNWSRPGALVLLAATLCACQAPVTPGAAGAPMPAPLTFAPVGPVAAPVLASLRLTLTPAPGGPTMADLDADTDPYDAVTPAVAARLSAEGLDSAAATLEVRGQSSRLTAQKSYQIKLKKDQPAWQGTRHLLLNKHPYDLTRVRNKLSFDLMAGIPGLPALGTSFAQLSIDGKDYGLFTRIERPDESFLGARGLDPKGSLYKAQDFTFIPDDRLKAAGAAGYDQAAFERALEIKGSKDHTRLLAMLAAVNDESVPINQTIERYFDRDNYLSWLAVNVLMRNLDTNSQNFLLYCPADRDRWTFLPWDYDGAWGFYEQPDQVAAGSTLARWEDGLSNWWGVRLHRRFLQAPGNLAALQARIDQLATGYFTRARVQAYLEAYKPVVRPLVLQAPDLTELPIGPGASASVAWEAEYDKLAGQVELAYARYREALERPMPVFLGEPTREGDAWRFGWDASYDLQGDAISYDWVVSRQPDLSAPILSKTGLSEPQVLIREPLPAGKLYYGVIVRDAKDPARHYQLPFDDVREGQRVYHGVRAFSAS